MKSRRTEIVATLACLLALSIYMTLPSFKFYSRQMLDLVQNFDAKQQPDASNATGSRSEKLITVLHAAPLPSNESGTTHETSVTYTAREIITSQPVESIQPAVVRNSTNKCLELNSVKWLQGSRVSNIEIPTELVDAMMHPHRLLDQHNTAAVLGNTLCYETGRFRSIPSVWNASDSDQIQDWEFRLLYLAIHRQSHLPAYPEYQRRQECLRQGANSLPVDLKNFDFECPNAKFLITVLNTMGMGATFRTGAMPSLLMAFAAGRVPLFVQSVQGEGLPRYLTNTFTLASCDRRDLQCVFLPTSPCTVTIEDLQNATYLAPDEVWKLKKKGELENKDHDNARVIVQETNMVPSSPIHKLHDKFRQKAYEAIWDLLNDWRNNTSKVLPEQWKVLTAAAEAFRQPYSNKDKGPKTYRALRATQFYLMRPNMTARQLIKKQVEGTVPEKLDKGNTQLFGLPIRGSDKCDSESTCLSFSTYMDLMVSKWEKHGDRQKRGTILLTSEDPTVLPKRFAYAQNSSFPFDFLVNDNDVQPGNGVPLTYREKADAIMISSLTAIQIQLQASVLVGNCCSNFHSMLLDFARDGCGADPNIHIECLDRIQDERFLICCGWTSGPVCERIRGNFKSSRQNITLS